ncbi:MAG: 50S ribosomal protein L11 methyltransferase [Opitutales bacterium]|nr:50S ribosomal protein L11 methyltransferase [Opitutales bacterium]
MAVVGRMIELRIPVSRELADILEGHFCEDYQETWMLRENHLTGAQTLCGFFASPEAAEAGRMELAQTIPDLPEGGEHLVVEDQDWKEAYKLHFKPWSDRGLHWVPIWEKHSYPLPEGDQIVYLDPGMAFGTGNHETTRLCVRRLLDAKEEWGGTIAEKSVIDAGCGSGILAISARKVGFSPVYAFDNDPDAVSISRENEQLCDLDGQIEFVWADLVQGLEGRKADLIMANILAPILIDHARILVDALNPGGRLILSGILGPQAEEVQAAFVAASGRRFEVSSRSDGEWADVVLVDIT